MIKKITIFYVDNTFEDIDADYFNKSEAGQDTDVKTIKEIFIYFTTGKYMKIVADAKNELPFKYPDGVRKSDGPINPFEPKWPSGPWFDPTKIID